MPTHTSLYTNLAYAHLATVLPAFAIGTWLMLRRKGTSNHRWLGRIYMVLMLATAAITLFMPAAVGPTVFNHFGFIHLFSISVFITVPGALLAARARNVPAHKNNMIGLYVGGLLIAGSFALMPGRMLHAWLL